MSIARQPRPALRATLSDMDFWSAAPVAVKGFVAGVAQAALTVTLVGRPGSLESPNANAEAVPAAVKPAQ